jgi:segregation and condensation protein B
VAEPEPTAPETAERPEDAAQGLSGLEAEEGVLPGGETLDAVGEIDITDLGAPTLRSALEALLLVADEPLDVLTLASLTRRPVPEVSGELEGMAAGYTADARGFELRQVAGGWRYYTRADCAEVVERFVRDGQQARLTQASLETLAVVAYRQPVTRARIASVRGVNVDGVIRTLTARGLVAESGVEESSGALLYRTTGYFLERLGLDSVDELPPLADYLPDIDTLDLLNDQE